VRTEQAVALILLALLLSSAVLQECALESTGALHEVAHGNPEDETVMKLNPKSE
jgi:hypothetical protein